MKKRKFFHAPFVVASLFSAVFAVGYILGAADAFWGLRMHFGVAESSWFAEKLRQG